MTEEPQLVHTLRVGAANAVSALCLFRSAVGACGGSESLPARESPHRRRAFAAVGTRHGRVLIYALDSFRQALVLECEAHPPNATTRTDPENTDNAITCITFKAPILFCQTRSYKILAFDLDACLALAPAPATPLFSIPINSLNFCKAHLMKLDSGYSSVKSDPVASLLEQSRRTEGAWTHREPTRTARESLILPNTDSCLLLATTGITEESDEVDIINLNTKRFCVKGLHLSKWITSSSQANADLAAKIFSGNGQDEILKVPVKTGMVMCLKMISAENDGHGGRRAMFRILIGYESGDLACWQVYAVESDEEAVSELMWFKKVYEQPILCLDVDTHGKYVVVGAAEESFTRITMDHWKNKSSSVALPTGSKGVSSIQIRADGLAIALGCWDSMIRIYSGKSLTYLGVVGADVHRRGVCCLTFVDEEHLLENDSATSNSEPDVTESSQIVLVANRARGLITKERVQGIAKSGYGMRQEVLPKNMLAVGTEDGRVVFWRIY
ncbi:hypothetical protein BC830DRAFT_79500 [Chytriomyces sp. MP71]|nr:hypothetical protein BC830DRAFT_79500 [Chytriomyces sp. MP71]